MRYTTRAEDTSAAKYADRMKSKSRVVESMAAAVARQETVLHEVENLGAWTNGARTAPKISAGKLFTGQAPVTEANPERSRH